MSKHKFQLILGSVAFIASGALYGAIAMDQTDQNMPSEEEGTPNPASKVEEEAVKERVESESQRMYHLSPAALPKELLAAIFVQLEPRELLVAASVNTLWREIALQIMEGNLVKKGKLPPNSNPDMQMVRLLYREYFYPESLCPEIDDFSAFQTSMDKGEFVPNDVLKHEKMKFDYKGRKWFIDHPGLTIRGDKHSYYEELTKWRNSYRAFGSHMEPDRSTMVGPNFLKFETVNATGPDRLRCYYNFTRKSGDKVVENIDFHITTILGTKPQQ